MPRPMVLFCILSCLTIISLQSSAIATQITGKLAAGQSLTATTSDSGSHLLSPSGDFAFGFHQLKNNSDFFLLAIWYAKIPDTIVWYANDGYPVPQGSTVRVDPDQGLILADSQGTGLWNVSQSTNVRYGFMNDTGNFMLKNSGDNVLWESFQHPTDTLLPTQILERGSEVTSRRTETNFAKGRFQLCLQADGNLVLNTREVESNFGYHPYYASMQYDGNNQTTASHQLIYNDLGYMYVLRNDGSTYDLLKNPVSARDYYQRATMDVDGMFAWYYHPKTSTGHDWVTINKFPYYNICPRTPNDLDSGVCGYNSICSLKDDGRPRCECAANYSLLDPTDKFGSCKANFLLHQCDGFRQNSEEGKYNMVPILNTVWSSGDYAKLTPISEDLCKKSCLNDCFCAAVVYDGAGTCLKKKLPLSRGYEDVNVSGTTWLKVSDYSTELLSPSLPALNHRKKVNKVLLVLLSGSTFANFILLSAVALGAFLIYKKHGFRRLDINQRRTQREHSTVTCFSYQELIEATNGFKEIIGRGAFGVVYKGMIGRTGGPGKMVAVKKLDRVSRTADKEFETEVNVIGQTHHKNLVRLMGFCKEEDERLLVYEYMSNGTVAEYLFGDLKPSWSARMQIIKGVARGLLYLHEECDIQIIHCDIKPQNILLDGYQNARISDFGLAKLLDVNQSHTNTAIRGTKGYVAPEWFRNKPVTVKVDVYSFGVLLLEILCCRRSVCLDTSTEERAILTDWAVDCYQSKKLESLVNDEMEAVKDTAQLERCVMVALWCIQEDPSLRPTMRIVTQMLEGLAQVPPPPRPSSFSTVTQ